MAWLDRPLGKAVTGEERRCLTELLAAHPPFPQALVVGAKDYRPLFDVVADRSRWWCLLVPASGEGLAGERGLQERPGGSVWGLPEQLPFPSGGLDLVVVVHALEFSRSPYQVVAEAVRTLAPGGRLVVFAFNPISLFGVGRSLGRQRRAEGGPWHGRFRSGLALRRMAESAGLSFEASHYLMLRPPLKQAGALWATRFLEGIPFRQRLPVGGVVCLVARKDEPGMTRLGPAFRAELQRTPGRMVPNP